MSARRVQRLYSVLLVQVLQVRFQSMLVWCGVVWLSTLDLLESLPSVLSQRSEDLLDIAIHVVVQLGQACRQRRQRNTMF